MLRATGELSERAIKVNDREFRVGDWVVARKNKHRLRGFGNSYVKNGSIGTIASFDSERRTVTVEFDKEGVITLPDWYLENDGLDYAYARTTYRVQGKALKNVGYQPTDLSSFEEGYVAITRAKSGTRIYLVEDGARETGQPHCGDGAHEYGRQPELIVKALEAKRSKLMAHKVIACDRDL